MTRNHLGLYTVFHWNVIFQQNPIRITFPVVFENIRLTIGCQNGTNNVVGEEIPMTTSSLVIYMYKKAVNGFLLTNRKNHKLLFLTHAAQLMIYSVMTDTI